MATFVYKLKGMSRFIAIESKSTAMVFALSEFGNEVSSIHSKVLVTFKFSVGSFLLFTLNFKTAEPSGIISHLEQTPYRLQFMCEILLYLCYLSVQPLFHVTLVAIAFAGTRECF